MPARPADPRLRAPGATASGLSSKRLVMWAAVFAVFVLFDIALFGYLILNSLSQRELEKVLLETRQEAEPIAERLNAAASLDGRRDLYAVVRSASETQTYLEGVLQERELLRSIEIRDLKGAVVYQKTTRDALPVDGSSPRLDNLETFESVEVPIGDLGTLVVGLSEEEVAKRIGVLRKDLTRLSTGIGVLTMLLLVAAFGAFLVMHRRARRLEEQAAEAERMAYIGTLASGLAHEIRSPLNSLSLNIQMLEEEARQAAAGGPRTGMPAGSQRLLKLTRSELKRLERLASDFLSYARPQPLDTVPVKVGTLLLRLREILDGELRERQVRAEVDDRSQGATIEADPAQITQLLLNLANNGLAAIAARREHEPTGPEGVLTLAARREGDDVVLEVGDNGEGIPPEVRAKMFDLFYSNRKGGTGLGLAIALRIAQAHGASLEVQDPMPGPGALLRVVFPRRSRGGSSLPSS